MRRERARALEDIGEGVALDFDLQRLALARRNEDVEIARIGGDAFDRAPLAPELAAHDAHARAVVVDDLGNVGGLDVLVARRRHLQRRGQVGPELEAVHAALRVALRHFLMHDAAARGHPLHVAGAERAAVAEAVAVLDGAGEHVGDGLDAAVRMPGEAGADSLPGCRCGNRRAAETDRTRSVLPKPKARRSLTPAPSIVGFD